MKAVFQATSGKYAHDKDPGKLTKAEGQAFAGTQKRAREIKKELEAAGHSGLNVVEAPQAAADRETKAAAKVEAAKAKAKAQAQASKAKAKAATTA